jgi:hypothetical protein
VIDFSSEALPLPPSNRVMFDGASAVVGIVRCSPRAPDFAQPCAAVCHCFAFPRSTVVISQARRRPFVEDPTVVSFYNAGQEYRRGELAPDGDRCEWFGVAESLVRDAVRAYDVSAAESDEPFRFASAHVPASVYLQQRLVCEHLKAVPATTDRLYVEEAVVDLLSAVVRACYPSVKAPSPPAGQARDVADRAREVLARRSPAPDDAPGARSSGRRVGLSPVSRVPPRSRQHDS